MANGSYIPDISIPAPSYDWTRNIQDHPSYASRNISLDSCHSYGTSSASNPTTPSFALAPIKHPRSADQDHERLSRWFSDQSRPENLHERQTTLFEHPSPSTGIEIPRLSPLGSEGPMPRSEETLSTIRNNPFYRKKVLLACYFCRRRKMACTPSESGNSSSCA